MPPGAHAAAPTLTCTLTRCYTRHMPTCRNRGPAELSTTVTGVSLPELPAEPTTEIDSKFNLRKEEREGERERQRETERDRERPTSTSLSLGRSIPMIDDRSPWEREGGEFNPSTPQTDEYTYRIGHGDHNADGADSWPLPPPGMCRNKIVAGPIDPTEVNARLAMAPWYNMCGSRESQAEEGEKTGGKGAHGRGRKRFRWEAGRGPRWRPEKAAR